MIKTVDVLFKYLPIRVSRAVNLLPQQVLENANEIRIRKFSPISVTVGTKNIFFNEDGAVCNVNCAMHITDSEFKECLSRLTGGSLYTCDEYVTSGFIPLAEGGRAGVCGRINLRDGKICGFSEIYSVDLRLHRFIPDAAKPLVDELRKNGLRGTIVCSPPALGKTTFLRSAAYLLSAGKGISPRRVGIADERNEISVGISGVGLLDILSSAPKADAINMLTRTMAPEVIICDEISANEADAVLEAQNTGVCLIASAHCTDPSGLLRRGRMKQLLESGVFPLCAVLGYEDGYTCTVSETEAYLT